MADIDLSGFDAAMEEEEDTSLDLSGFDSAVSEEPEAGTFEAVQEARGGRDWTTGDVLKQVGHTLTGGLGTVYAPAAVEASVASMKGEDWAQARREAEERNRASIQETQAALPDSARTLASMVGGVAQGGALAASKVPAAADALIGIGSEVGEAQAEGASARETALRASLATLGGVIGGVGTGVAAKLSPTARLTETTDVLLKEARKRLTPETMQILESSSGKRILEVMAEKRISPKDLLEGIQNSPQVVEDLVKNIYKQIGGSVESGLARVNAPAVDRLRDLNRQVQEQQSELSRLGIEEAKVKQTAAEERIPLISERPGLIEEEGALKAQKAELDAEGVRVGSELGKAKELGIQQQQVLKQFKNETAQLTKEVLDAGPEEAANFFKNNVQVRIAATRKEAANLENDSLQKMKASGKPNVFDEEDIADLGNTVDSLVKGIDRVNLGSTGLQQKMADLANLARAGMMNESLGAGYQTLVDVKKQLNGLIGGYPEGSQERWFLSRFRDNLYDKLASPKITEAGFENVTLANKLFAESYRAEDTIQDIALGRIGRENVAVPGSFVSSVRKSPEAVEAIEKQLPLEDTEAASIRQVAEEIRTGGEAAPEVRVRRELENKLQQQQDKLAKSQEEMKAKLVDTTAKKSSVVKQLSETQVKLKKIESDLDKLKATEAQKLAGIKKDTIGVKSYKAKLSDLREQIKGQLEEIDIAKKTLNTTGRLSEKQISQLKGSGVPEQTIQAMAESKRAGTEQKGLGERLAPFTREDVKISEAIPQTTVTDAARNLELNKSLQAEGLDLAPLISGWGAKEALNPNSWRRLASAVGAATGALVKMPLLGIGAIREIQSMVRNGDPIDILRRITLAMDQAEKAGMKPGSQAFRMRVLNAARSAGSRAVGQGAAEQGRLEE